jgi:hypothetical protein
VLEFEGAVESLTLGTTPPRQDLISITLRSDQVQRLAAVIAAEDKDRSSIKQMG